MLRHGEPVERMFYCAACNAMRRGVFLKFGHPATDADKWLCHQCDVCGSVFGEYSMNDLDGIIDAIFDTSNPSSTLE